MTSRPGLAARLIGAVLLLCVATTAQAEKRVALVIGNSAYQTVPRLPNPADDAKLMADTLLSLGFFVVGAVPKPISTNQASTARCRLSKRN